MAEKNTSWRGVEVRATLKKILIVIAKSVSPDTPAQMRSSPSRASATSA
jgi:hypothetical protein